MENFGAHAEGQVDAWHDLRQQAAHLVCGKRSGLRQRGFLC
jgi:hypothetical protein